MPRTDKEIIKSILPEHYEITESAGSYGFNCVSKIGIDENDPEQWDYTMKAFRQTFGERLKEVYHSTCTNHLDFCVYLEPREHEAWTELSDKFREVAHRYKDGEFDYRTVWRWFQDQSENFELTKKGA